MAARMPKPINTIRLVGSNNYVLLINDHGDDGVTAVIEGAHTGKRHANVTLEWSDLEELVDWATTIMTEDCGGDDGITANVKPEYL